MYRPTWDPAVGRADSKAYSKQYSARDAPAQTKLKFRSVSLLSITYPFNICCSKPGQGGTGDQDKRRDLRLELNKAEDEANEKKRKAQGLSLEDIGQSADDSEQKRPKFIQNVDEDEEHAEPEIEGQQTSQANPQNVDKDEEADDDEER